MGLSPSVCAALLLWACLAHLQHPVVHSIASLRPAFLPIHPAALARNLAVSAGLLAMAAAVVGGWWAWGVRVRAWAGGGRRETGPFALAAGLLAGSLAIAGLGLAGLFFRPVLGLLLIGLAAGAVRARAWAGPVRWISAARWRDAWPGLCLLPAVPWIVAAPLLPVTNVDMLEYHAGLPVLWTMVHRIHNETGNLLFTMPLGFERLSIPFIAIGAGGANAWTDLILLAVGAFAVARAIGTSSFADANGVEGDVPCGRPSTSGASAAMGGWLVFGWGAAIGLAGEGHPDTGLVVAAALASLAVARGSAVDIGLACALAAFAKHQGAGLAAVILVSAVPWSFGMRRAFRFGAVAAAVAATPSLAWLARDWWLTGNPVYPLASHVFPSLAWTDWNTQMLWGSMPNASVTIGGYFPDETARQLALAFWEGAKSFWFSPHVALVYALPLALFARGIPKLARPLAAQAALFGLAWLLPIPKFGRYLLPGLVPALVAWWLMVTSRSSAARGVAPSGATPTAAITAAVAAVIITVEGLMFVVVSRDGRVPPERVLAGSATADEYGRSALGGYQDAVDWLNEGPVGRSPGRTLVVGQGYGLGLAHPWFASNETGRPAWLTAAGDDPDPVRMRIHIRQANVRWVLYNPIRAYSRHSYALGYPLSEAWLSAWAEVWRRWIEVARPPDRFDWTGGWWVYRLGARPGPPRPQPWLPGAERLQLPDGDLLAGRADPEPLALQRRVAGDFGVALFQRSMLTFYGGHDAARAAREAEEAVRRGLTTPGALNMLAVFLDAAGRPAEAGRRLREALALDPAYGSARANLEAILARPRTAAR